MTFKTGDRVIVSNNNWDNAHGTVVSDKNSEWGEDRIAVRIDGFSSYLSETDYHPIRKGHILHEGQTEPPSSAPAYYDFPGGVQVRDISAHLTSFGGQALQYVARATRLDGNNKGESVKDLQKAIDFIQWEIERLEASND